MGAKGGGEMKEWFEWLALLFCCNEHSSADAKNKSTAQRFQLLCTTCCDQPREPSNTPLRAEPSRAELS